MKTRVFTNIFLIAALGVSAPATMSAEPPANNITFTDPATQTRLGINPAYLDPSGRVTIRFLAQCEPHLAPFIVPEIITADTETKMLKREEEVNRTFLPAFYKHTPKEREKMNKAVCFAVVSNHYDLKKLAELMNRDLATGSQFAGVLHLIACKPESVAKDDLAQILAHAESHYDTAQLDAFYSEFKRVYTESKTQQALPEPAP